MTPAQSPKPSLGDLQACLDQMPHGANLQPLASILNCPPARILDFSANLHPAGPPREILVALQTQLGDLAFYPQPYPVDLVAALAGKHQVPADYIIPGAGAADLIFRLALALKPAKPQVKRVLLPLPNFNEYGRAFQAAGFSLDRVNHLFGRPWPDLAKLWDHKHSALLLCQPNNPTGQVYPLDFTLELLARAVDLDRYLIIDQCFMDFLPPDLALAHSGPSLTRQVANSCRHLITFHSLTKFYVIPGLRLGYLICPDQNLADRVRQLTPPWPVSQPANLAGLTALSLSPAWHEERRNQVQKLRQKLISGLVELNQQAGREVFYQISGQANFICFQTTIPQLAARLLAGSQPCYIRQLKTVPGAPENSYRIAVKSWPDQVILLSQLAELLT